MRLWLLLVTFGLGRAEEQTCDYDANQISDFVLGSPSGTGNDAESVARCGAGYVLADCKCRDADQGTGGGSYGYGNDCDGARIRDDQTGASCIAYNSHGGAGVVAKARCVKGVITCSTTETNLPLIRCPAFHKLSGCTMYSSVRDSLYQGPSQTKRPVSKRGRGGPCSFRLVDMVLLVDDSSWTGQTGFQALVDFVHVIADTLTIGPDDVQVGAVMWSAALNRAKKIFDIGQYGDAASLKAAVSALPFSGGEGFYRKFQQTMELARDMLVDGSGTRDGAYRVVFYLGAGHFKFSSAPDNANYYVARPADIKVMAASAGDASWMITAVATGQDFRFFDVDEIDRDAQEALIQTAFFDTLFDCYGYCYTSAGCSQCSVQARCIRSDYDASAWW